MKTVPSIISRFLSPLSFGEGQGVRLAVLLALLFLASCGEQTELEQPVVADGETVEVTKEIQINLLPIQTMGAGTRAGEEKPEKGEAIHVSFDNDAATRVQEGTENKTPEEATIKNAYIVQFNGAEPTATAAWVSKDIKDQLDGSTPITATLSMTAGKKNRVYVIANCASAPTLGMTLATFEAPVSFTPVTSLAAGNLPYSACQDLGVGDVFQPFQLKSVLAKLTFTTSVGTAKLMNVPTGYSFYTQTQPGDNAMCPAGMTYNTTGVALTSGTTYYVPENLSGRNNQLLELITRCAYFAPANSMCVQISANGTTYNIYLGDGTPQDFNFVGGYSYHINATINGADTYDLRVGNPIPVGTAMVDLNSQNGNKTANCYIVTANNSWYMFNSTVMGNGAVTRANGAANAADIVPSRLNPVSADVLWETLNTVTAPAKGDVAMAYALKDRILFRTGSKQGNAVIAARDVNNNIIWSWHIWKMAAQPVSVPLADLISASGNFDATGTTTLSGLQIMDRNLGALSATAQDNLSSGLLYQWGRKDPFPAYAELVDSEGAAMSTLPSEVPIIPGSEAQYTVAQSISQPTTFYVSNSDWTTYNDNLWGTPLTGSVVINNGIDFYYNSNKGSKSIYDPCPVGWRVAPAYAFANANAGTASFDKGYIFTIGTASRSVWFPAAGCRYFSSGTLGGSPSTGGYWSSSPHLTGGAYCSQLYFQYDGYVDPRNSHYRASGFSVRCVSDE